MKEAPVPKEVEEGVPEAPRFIQTLQQHIDAIEGTPVTLECVTVGQPVPTVTWFQVGIVYYTPLKKWLVYLVHLSVRL